MIINGVVVIYSAVDLPMSTIEEIFKSPSNHFFPNLQFRDELPTRDSMQTEYGVDVLRGFKFRGIISTQDICPAWLIEGLDENILYTDSH